MSGRGNVLWKNGGERSGGEMPRGDLSVSLPFPSLPFLTSFLPLPFPSLPLEVRPLNTASESGERCKLSRQGLGRSPSGNRIWYILSLKSDIWWHEFYQFS